MELKEGKMVKVVDHKDFDDVHRVGTVGRVKGLKEGVVLVMLPGENEPVEYPPDVLEEVDEEEQKQVKAGGKDGTPDKSTPTPPQTKKDEVDDLEGEQKQVAQAGGGKERPSGAGQSAGVTADQVTLKGDQKQVEQPSGGPERPTGSGQTAGVSGKQLFMYGDNEQVDGATSTSDEGRGKMEQADEEGEVCEKCGMVHEVGNPCPTPGQRTRSQGRGRGLARGRGRGPRGVPIGRSEGRGPGLRGGPVGEQGEGMDKEVDVPRAREWVQTTPGFKALAPETQEKLLRHLVLGPDGYWEPSKYTDEEAAELYDLVLGWRSEASNMKEKGKYGDEGLYAVWETLQYDLGEEYADVFQARPSGWEAKGGTWSAPGAVEEGVLRPISINVLEEGDKEDEYLTVGEGSSIRSEHHLVRAIHGAVRKAMESMTRPFDVVDVVFRRAPVQEAERRKAERDLLASLHLLDEGKVKSADVRKVARAAAKLGVRTDRLTEYTEDRYAKKILEDAIKEQSVGGSVSMEWPPKKLTTLLGKHVIIETRTKDRFVGTLAKGPGRTFQIKTRSGTHRFSPKDVNRILVKPGAK